MINGPRYKDFVCEDIPLIRQEINELSANFEQANKLTKNHIEQELKEKNVLYDVKECQRTPR